MCDEQKKLIGKIISLKRNELNLTQVQLAEKSGLSRSFIADIESGRYLPSVSSLVSIVSILKIDLNFLLKNDGNTIKGEVNNG